MKYINIYRKFRKKIQDLVVVVGGESVKVKMDSAHLGEKDRVLRIITARTNGGVEK